MHLFDAPYLASLAVSAGRACLMLALLVSILGPLERLFFVRRARFLYPGWMTNIGWYFVNSLVTVFVLGPPTLLIGLVMNALIPAGFKEGVAALPLAAKMVAAMIVGEFGFYWGHRLSHELPFLWRFHAVHHSAEHLNFLVNTRAHPVDLVFTRMCGLTLLYATGLTSVVGPHPTLIPALVLFVGSMWSFVIHANVRWRLGWLEHVISTPAFHHWHHTRSDHIDHNYASMIPLLDHLFGTFYLPKKWPTAYGTDTSMPVTMVGQMLRPFAPRAIKGVVSRR